MRYPVNHLVQLFSSQYVTKSSNELHQRAVPKQAPVLTIVDERDDSVERQVQRIPTIEPVVTDEISTLKPATEDEALQNSVSSTVEASDETPHVHVETDEAKEARLDRQWKQLKVDVAELPDIYARLAKIKLTGRIRISCLQCHFKIFTRNSCRIQIEFLIYLFGDFSTRGHDCSCWLCDGSSAL